MIFVVPGASFSGCRPALTLIDSVAVFANRLPDALKFNFKQPDQGDSFGSDYSYKNPCYVKTSYFQFVFVGSFI